LEGPERPCKAPQAFKGDPSLAYPFKNWPNLIIPLRHPGGWYKARARLQGLCDPARYLEGLLKGAACLVMEERLEDSGGLRGGGAREELGERGGGETVRLQYILNMLSYSVL
jgi:hypothetical protein